MARRSHKTLTARTPATTTQQVPSKEVATKVRIKWEQPEGVTPRYANVIAVNRDEESVRICFGDAHLPYGMAGTDPVAVKRVVTQGVSAQPVAIVIVGLQQLRDMIRRIQSVLPEAARIQVIEEQVEVEQ